MLILTVLLILIVAALLPGVEVAPEPTPEPLPEFPAPQPVDFEALLILAYGSEHF